MKLIVWALMAGAALTPMVAAAEVCLTADGYVVPCPAHPGPDKVKSHFTAVMPTQAGVPADVYIVGGGAVTPASDFQIRVNRVTACVTDGQGISTPIRHCIVTINAPGTYTIDAMPTNGGSNFEPPYPVVTDVH